MLDTASLIEGLFNARSEYKWFNQLFHCGYHFLNKYSKTN